MVVRCMLAYGPNGSCMHSWLQANSAPEVMLVDGYEGALGQLDLSKARILIAGAAMPLSADDCCKRQEDPPFLWLDIRHRSLCCGSWLTYASKLVVLGACLLDDQVSTTAGTWYLHITQVHLVVVVVAVVLIVVLHASS
jgi:hypothetical protein